MTHELKTWPEHFEQVWNRVKKFEVRKKDRPYKVGDRLYLKEFDPNTQKYTGRCYNVEVTHLLNGGQFGIEKGFCVMSIE